ncbi:MAG: ubiquinone/menaquinone biosynthesis methyltransferase [bacterium]
MDIKGLFRGIIKDYDRMNAIMSLGFHNRWRLDCVKRANLQGKILDIGCGTGDFCQKIKKCKDTRVFGMDVLEDMLEVARKKCEINPIVGNALFLPFKSLVFDGITLGFVLRHIDIQSFLKEAMRVLKPCGKLVILELSFPKQRFIRFFFKIYLYKIIPFIAKLLSDEPSYSYLGESLKHLPEIEEIEEMAYKSGAKNVMIKRFMFGSIFFLLAVK